MPLPFGLTLVSAPATEPVTTAEAKLWAKVEHSADDDLIAEMIGAARELAEVEWDRTIVTTTWKTTYPRFPVEVLDRETGCLVNGIIRLPRGPLLTVSSIQYLDTDGALQTWSSSEYVVVASKDPGEVHLADGFAWPATDTHPEAVRITFNAGYGAAAAVPKRVKAALKLAVAWWHAHRGDDGEVVMDELPEASARLLRSVWNGSY